MDIKDKIKISKKRFCMPHYWPHKLPFGKKVCNEACHIHKNPIRMLHHNFYCKVLNCPNYKFMRTKDKKMIKRTWRNIFF